MAKTKKASATKKKNRGTASNPQSPNGNPPILTVENLKKTYGKLIAVNKISFNVYENEIFGILGPNGAGKTTTLEMIEGLRKIDSGTATLDGIDIKKKSKEVKRRIGIQLQANSFYEHLNLCELLSLFGRFYGRKVDPMEILKKVNLQDKAKEEVDNLSGGQKQRLSIAAALVNDPKVIFLDEPTTGLDPQARRNLWDLITEIRDVEKKTIILTTHYMDEAEVLCDRVAIMDHGDILKMKTPAELIDDLIKKGFKKKNIVQQATLEDVFLDLTGRTLRE